MIIFWGFIFVLVEMVKTSIVFVKILNYKMVTEKYKYVVYFFVQFWVIVLIHVFEQDAWITNAIVLLLFTLLPTIYLFKNRFSQIMLAFVLVYICVACMDIFCVKIISLLFSDSVVKLEDGRWHLIYNSSGLFFLYFVSCILNRIYHTKEQVELTKEWTAIIVGAIVYAMMTLGCLVLRAEGITKTDNIFNFLFSGVCIFVIVGIAIIIILVNARETYRTKAVFNEKLLQKQQEYYKNKLDQDEEIKRFRHDLRHHIQCLKIISEKEGSKELIDYINKIDGTISANIYQYDVGNDLVNCILSDIDRKFMNKNIKLVVDGYFPENIAIDNMDLCIIVSNLLTNAFEAAEKVITDEIKEVSFHIKTLNKILYFEIDNPVNARVIIPDRIAKTTKEDKRHHGYGIVNIKESLKRYNGRMEYVCTESEMQTKIMFYTDFNT